MIKTKYKLGKWSSTSLVVGNMIGAGVFMMPALLAVYGGISLIGWILSAMGAIMIAALFSQLSKLVPGKQGGPYAYTRTGVGEFPAFLVAWGYWISVWTTNAALSVAFVSYLAVIFPFLELNVTYSVGMAILVLWLLSWYNTLGIKKVGRLALITTILKVIPILLIGIWGLFFINLDYFQPLNLSSESNFMAIVMTITLTFFSFLGIESATIPADNVQDPENTIPFATKWGTLIAAAVYIISSMTIMGLISPEELSNSSAPFADAASFLWGGGGKYLIAIAAVISVFGALNGWILIQGQMPEAIARDKLFPAVFAKNNKMGVPAIGIFISSLLATILIIMNYAGGLMKIFEFMILVSTVSVLIPYLFCAVALVNINKDEKLRFRRISTLSLAIGTCLFAIIALIGSGKEAIIWGVLFLLLGVPVYFMLKRGK